MKDIDINAMRRELNMLYDRQRQEKRDSYAWQSLGWDIRDLSKKINAAIGRNLYHESQLREERERLSDLLTVARIEVTEAETKLDKARKDVLELVREVKNAKELVQFYTTKREALGDETATGDE